MNDYADYYLVKNAYRVIEAIAFALDMVPRALQTKRAPCAITDIGLPVFRNVFARLEHDRLTEIFPRRGSQIQPIEPECGS